MTGPASRRGFLRGLTTLPLIGGSVTLIGSPTAVAEPVTAELLRVYVAFLAREHGHAHDELLRMEGPEPHHWAVAPQRPIADLHLFNWPRDARADALVSASPPSTRAALVLSTVSADWRGGERRA